MPARSVSVIVPVFRSAQTLRELHRRTVEALAPLGRPFEIVLVEDCGGDESWQVIEALARSDQRVRGVRLSRNYGQHSALLCGIRAAQHEVVVTLDDDLQNPPEEIPRLLARLEEGCDVVYGAPEREQHGFLRGRAAAVTKLALRKAMGSRTARHVSAFRAFRTYLREAFRDYRSPFVSVDVLLTWGTTRFDYVTVRHDPRRAGVSNYTLRALATHALNMVTGFTTLPLQLASVLGLLFSLFGMCALAYVLSVFVMYGRSVPGFAFLASMIAIFSGVQLFALGIIGEYLARMHLRSMDRPPYLVREHVAQPTQARGAESIARLSA
jgi:undecaprenyl-phosphate 4-deoxy-4-formamido-L-arabinose transferase